jgi:hypothetical protein
MTNIYFYHYLVIDKNGVYIPVGTSFCHVIIPTLVQVKSEITHNLTKPFDGTI